MYSINFLDKRSKQLSKIEKQDQKILRYTAIGFAVLGVVTMGLLGGRFYFQSQLGSLQAKEKSLESEVMSYESTEEAFLFYVDKLETLEKLFKEREDKQAAIEYFSQVFGQEVIIQNIAYDARNANITFGLQAKDVFVLDNVFSALSSEQTMQLFKKVERSDLRRSVDGSYTVQVVVTFADKEEAK